MRGQMADTLILFYVLKLDLMEGVSSCKGSM